MAKRSRLVSINETGHNFYIAAKPPFEDTEIEFHMLDLMATSVHLLEGESTQVFVIPRSNFGSTAEAQRDGVRRELIGMAGDVGRFTLASTIQRFQTGHRA